MVVAVAVAIVVVESIFPLEIQPCLSSRVLPFSHHRRERERERERQREKETKREFYCRNGAFFWEKRTDPTQYLT